MLAVAACMAAAGCQTRPEGLRGRAGPAEEGTPFAAASIQLHPLTRVDRHTDGEPMIVAYLDIRDAWNDSTKAIGALKVLLYRPASGSGVGSDQQELTWDLDLSDLERNAMLYDGVTHMYRLPLLEAPAWVVPEPGREPPRMRLRALLDTFGPKGEARQLETDLLIGG